jgi:hypothetical protein
MPRTGAGAIASQGVVTATVATASERPGTVPTWQAGHATTPASAARSSQQGHGSSWPEAGLTAATTTPGNAAQSAVATRARMARRRAAGFMRGEAYAGRGGPVSGSMAAFAAVSRDRDERRSQAPSRDGAAGSPGARCWRRSSPPRCHCRLLDVFARSPDRGGHLRRSPGLRARECAARGDPGQLASWEARCRADARAGSSAAAKPVSWHAPPVKEWDRPRPAPSGLPGTAAARRPGS